MTTPATVYWHVCVGNQAVRRGAVTVTVEADDEGQARMRGLAQARALGQSGGVAWCRRLRGAEHADTTSHAPSGDRR